MEISDMYGEETQYWQESPSMYDRFKEDLDRHVGLRIGLWRLREKLGSWEGDRERYASLEEDNRRGIDRQLPQIIEGRNKSAISVEENGDSGNIAVVQDAVGPEIRIEEENQKRRFGGVGN